MIESFPYLPDVIALISELAATRAAPSADDLFKLGTERYLADPDAAELKARFSVPRIAALYNSWDQELRRFGISFTPPMCFFRWITGDFRDCRASFASRRNGFGFESERHCRQASTFCTLFLRRIGQVRFAISPKLFQCSWHCDVCSLWGNHIRQQMTGLERLQKNCINGSQDCHKSALPLICCPAACCLMAFGEFFQWGPVQGFDGVPTFDASFLDSSTIALSYPLPCNQLVYRFDLKWLTRVLRMLRIPRCSISEALLRKFWTNGQQTCYQRHEVDSHLATTDDIADFRLAICWLEAVLWHCPCCLAHICSTACCLGPGFISVAFSKGS